MEGKYLIAVPAIEIRNVEWKRTIYGLIRSNVVTRRTTPSYRLLECLKLLKITRQLDYRI